MKFWAVFAGILYRKFGLTQTIPLTYHIFKWKISICDKYITLQYRINVTLRLLIFQNLVHCFALIRYVTFILFFITCPMSCLFNTSRQFSFGKFFIVSCKGLNFCCQFLSFCQLLSANKKVPRGLCEQKLSEVQYR